MKNKRTGAGRKRRLHRRTSAFAYALLAFMNLRSIG
jgi:hypothetical protein